MTKNMMRGFANGICAGLIAALMLAVMIAATSVVVEARESGTAQNVSVSEEIELDTMVAELEITENGVVHLAEMAC